VPVSFCETVPFTGYERYHQSATKRACELCGREERWDADMTGWRIADEPGEVYCIHEWDINGTYTPVEE